MTKTYLLDIVKALHPSKRQEFASFLSSSALNRSKNAQEIFQLYQIVLESGPDFSVDTLQKDQVYARIFPGQTFELGRLEKLVSDLNKMLRQFILTQQYFSEENEDLVSLDWAKWLRSNGMTEHSQKIVHKLEGKKEKEPKESLAKIHLELLIAEEKHLQENTRNFLKGDLEIPRLVQTLDQYYKNYRVELENRYLLQQKGTQLPNLEFMAPSLAETNIYQFSKQINEIFSSGTPSVEAFQGLVQRLRDMEEFFSFQTLAHYYAYLRGVCTLLINGGQLEFAPILHEIHKDNLARNYFFVSGEIAPNAYLNLVQVAIRVQEFDWAKEFTEKYKSRVLGGDENQFFYRFNMAHCFFAEGNFEQALDQMPEAPSSSHYHHIVRLLELKIYYELHSELLPYKIDAFRKFTVRTATKTIAANLREMDLNFLNILTQLSQSPLKDKARSEKLLKRIASKKLLADRAWLIEKAKELG